MSTTSTPELVRRYERLVYDDEDTTYDVFYTDRTTGHVVVSYDGADPANTNPAYGGCSDREYFERKGLDIDEGVERSRCLKSVSDAEVAQFTREMARKAQREKEEAEARDLNDVIPDAMSRVDFSSESYRDDEFEIIKPALEGAGFTNIGFYMVEQDSFGPLIRGVRATDKEGARVRFFYG